MTAMNEASVEEITTYVHSVTARDSSSKLPSAIIAAGPNISAHGAILEQLEKTVTEHGRKCFVVLTSGQASNLKSLLKSLISKATSSEAFQDDDDDEQPLDAQRGRPRLLSYDLQILYNAVLERKLEQVIIAFQDCEAFDGALLSDTIELLR